MGLTTDSLRKVLIVVLPVAQTLIGILACEAASIRPRPGAQLGARSSAVLAQTLQEPPSDESPIRPTKEERQELKRIKAEQEAIAKAAAKQAKQLERAQRDEAKAREKAERQSRRQAEKAIARIKALHIEDRDGEVFLTIRLSRVNKWLARERRGGGLILRLMNTEAAAGVAPLTRPDGIVASVNLMRSNGGEPTTEIEIATRGNVSSSVQDVGSGLVVRLHSSDQPGATAETVEDSVDKNLLSPHEFDQTLRYPDYRVGAGDLLAIEIFGLPELSRQIRVEGNGNVNFPVLGGVRIAGLPLRGAEDKLVGLLAARGLVNNPVVSIVVEEYLSRGVSVQGAVTNPGVYQLLGPKRLLELLVGAGGLADGDPTGRTINVLRSLPEGGQLRTEIDAERLLELGDLSLNVALQPGDVVQVPRPQQVRVYVSGAVRTPGPIDYLSSERLTILQAVSAAGGPTERARMGEVLVIRRHEDGTEERFDVDLKKIRNGKQEDFVLEPGDTIVLNEWFF